MALKGRRATFEERLQAVRLMDQGESPDDIARILGVSRRSLFAWQHSKHESRKHPYREPLWAQLITAYYLTGRQSDALNAYQRLKTTLADDLGIDPNPTVQSLHERILRQEPLDVKTAAKTTAVANASCATGPCSIASCVP